MSIQNIVLQSLSLNFITPVFVSKSRPRLMKFKNCSKVDKNHMLLVKKCSDKKYKPPVSEPTKLIPNENEQNCEQPNDELELPPPMKSISEAISVHASDSNTVRSQTEQHTTATAVAIPVDFYADMMDGESRLKNDVTECEEALHKREYVIRELVSTERDYVRDLSLVVEGYMTVMRDPEAARCDIPIPEDLTEKYNIIFGNIKLIYEWHRDIFLAAIERCLTQPHEISQVFKKYERRLLMYVKYCHNKPLSEYLVSDHNDYFEEMRQFLGHKHQISDMLIKPVQRIMKYQLLLREIFKYTERARLADEMEALRQAMHIMQVVPKEANDMMDVGRLQDFDGKITAQGKLLLHGTLTCTKGPSNPNWVTSHKDLHVFLFERSIIFSEEIRKKSELSSSMYYYKAHILVNKMTLTVRHGAFISNLSEDFSDGSFVIKSIDPQRPPLWYVCYAHSDESRSEWLQNIRQILQKQQDFVKAVQSPIAYQKNKLMKEAN